MLSNALIISLIVLFLHITSNEGHIFEGIKKIIKPEWKISKPIYGCPVCMSIWHGIYIHLILFGWLGIIPFISTLFIGAGISVIYLTLLELRKAANTYTEKNL